MSSISRESKKDRGIFRLGKSFRYAKDGLVEAYKNEQTVWIYIPVALLVIAACIFFELSTIEWIIVILILGIIYCLELINTAIECTVDLVTKEYAELAKRAKDTVSAAVLVFAITSVIVGLIIFVPKIIDLF